ncbi:MAG: D-alanyl-D-alanine carboxypeptidase [Clostridia bacterium]|nr:D-alanyl-D-alanine carboxypeptidase [Clostridia bacterium]
MKKNIIIFVLCAAICAFPAAVPAAYAASAPEVSAKACVLYEPEGGRWLYEKNADVRLPMASTTKIMTAMVALRLLELDEVYTVPRDACGIEGSSLYLAEGDRVSVRDLLYALLLRSANDAASALAILACGSEEAFAAEMNAEAARLGLTNTHFINPHGLDAEGHYCSARDLALILAAAMEDERFVEISGCKKYTVQLEERAQVLYNHNKLLHLTDYALCGKTGFTKKSGRCLASAAVRDGVSLISVTLCAPDDWNDHIKLFNFGSDRLERKQVITESDAFRVPVTGGTKEELLCRPSQDFFAVTEKDGAPPTREVLLPSVIYAPVRQGDIIGVLRIRDDGKVIGEICLLAGENIEYKEQKRPALLRWLKEAVFGK